MSSNVWQTVVLMLGVAGCCVEAASQNLTGSVSDALNASPIGGVTIVLGTQGSSSGITGTDGRYSLRGLKRGSKVTLTYDKWGYGKYSVVVHISSSQMVQNVSLFKETVDAAYWSSWSQKRLAVTNQNQNAIVGSAWSEVESGGLSAEAKTVAARSLLAEAPSKNEAPESLLVAAGATRSQEQLRPFRIREAQEKEEAHDQREQARAQFEQARAQTEQAQREAAGRKEKDEDRSISRAERQQQDAVEQKEAMRERLRAQLNQVLQTRNSARGLIVSMSDVLFDTGKY
jgi:hypothetical protein